MESSFLDILRVKFLKFDFFSCLIFYVSVEFLYVNHFWLNKTETSWWR